MEENEVVSYRGKYLRSLLKILKLYIPKIPSTFCTTGSFSLLVKGIIKTNYFTLFALRKVVSKAEQILAFV